MRLCSMSLVLLPKLKFMKAFPLLITSLALLLSAHFPAQAVSYGTVLENVGENIDGLTNPTGEPVAELPKIIGLVVGTALEALGVIFLLLTIYAGFIWMTAQGNEETVTKAKTLLRNAIIGLIITLAAYSIASFVTDKIVGATSGSGTATPAAEGTVTI